MSNIEMLNNVTHKELTVYSGYSPVVGDNVASALTFITEFAEIQKEYPILFHEDAVSKELYAVALLGIQKEENLFLNPASKNGWAANYVPASIAKGPFSIGMQMQREGTSEVPTPVVNVDMSHPKVNYDNGVRVFLEKGGNSEYLDRVSNLLNLIRDGLPVTKMMFDAFRKHQLLEDVSIDIELENEDKFKLSGFKTIHAEKLQSLGGVALEELSRLGFLQAAYFVVASLSNVKHLIEIKNQSHKVR